MRVLVDTSYLYALMSSEDLFTAPERDFVERRNAEIFASAASIWEMRIYDLRTNRHFMLKQKPPDALAAEISADLKAAQAIFEGIAKKLAG